MVLLDTYLNMFNCREFCRTRPWLIKYNEYEHRFEDEYNIRWVIPWWNNNYYFNIIYDKKTKNYSTIININSPLYKHIQKLYNYIKTSPRTQISSNENGILVETENLNIIIVSTFGTPLRNLSKTNEDNLELLFNNFFI
jgi:hypothetical protein